MVKLEGGGDHTFCFTKIPRPLMVRDSYSFMVRDSYSFILYKNNHSIIIFNFKGKEDAI